MKATKLAQFVSRTWNRFARTTSGVAVFLVAAILFAAPAGTTNLKVMKTGLGSGTVASSDSRINCGANCDASYASAVSVILTATPDSDSRFVGWEGDCKGASTTCAVSMSVDRSVRPVFDLKAPIPELKNFTPAGIQAYLTANPTVKSPAQFLKALPKEYKQNWILMSRSESLQTGTAESPRILLPSADARFVFTVGMTEHSSYPGSHHNAVEFMQWEDKEKNFRLHEIVLDEIGQMGNVPPRKRGVSADDSKCSKCHSTRNVLNRSPFPGTDGIPPGTVKVKNKPNWDAYDSWGGMMPFNRDRIYKGSVEAAAFRKIFNLWTWRSNPSVRAIIEQLDLQPPDVPASHVITRMNGGTYDGYIRFPFDDPPPPVLKEPLPSGTDPNITTNYSFDGKQGTGDKTPVIRGGSFITLHHSTDPTNDEGRGVFFFDLLGGGKGTQLNQERIADELIHHRFATGGVPIDVRPIALAITDRCLSINGDTVASDPPLTINLGFFNERNGMKINQLLEDTRARAQSLPRRKADIEKLGLDRTGDVYLSPSPTPTPPPNGLVQQYGAATQPGTDTSMRRLRQEVFRRPIDLGNPDQTVMGGIYVDRELYFINTQQVALYRYFLEPLGVSVDKWSMGVRGRSGTYTFADVFGSYQDVLAGELKKSLGGDTGCATLVGKINTELARSLPPANAVPTFTDVQRIFNKNCIECHGGLGYPPYQNYGTQLDLSENESPSSGERRLTRSHRIASSRASSLTGSLYRRITIGDEKCPFGLMPCGGPPLSKADTETVRRWIVGGKPNTEGDPHLKTVDGVSYDFQADGEFVLLRDEGLEIQARQTAVPTAAPLGPNPHTGLTSCVSINTAAAVRIGPHRITYEPNVSGQPDPSGLQLRIDGKLTEMGEAEILLPSGGRIVRTAAPGGIQIESPGGTLVEITPGWWDYYQLWHMDIDTNHARATEGVMGAIAPGNWLPALPDGSFLGPMPADLHQRYIDLYKRFANAWRVTDATTLFDYAPGKSTSTLTIESWPEEAPPSCALPARSDGVANKPPEPALTPEAAKQECSAIVDQDRKADCIQDVTVTGERALAKTYLLAEQIERHAVPAAPTLDFPEDNKADLATTFDFTWKKVADLDGQPVTYRECVWPEGEEFTFIKNCDAGLKPAPWWRGSVLYPGLVALIGCVLLAILIFFTGMRKRRALLSLAAIVIVAAVVFAVYMGRTDKVSTTATRLTPGRAYFWKVIAEDGKGDSAESETRRFTVK